MAVSGKTPNGVQSLSRAFDLLSELARHHDVGLSLARLVERTGIDRTTAHRMLRFLVQSGFVQRAPDGKCHQLGVSAMMLGLRAMSQPPMLATYVTPMKSLARKTGDTVFLIVRIGDHGYCLHTEEGDHKVKAFTMLNGSSRLLGQGTASMALLAKMDNAAIQAHYSRHKVVYEADKLSLLKLLRGVEASRRRGYALAGAGGIAGVGYALTMPLLGEAAISVLSTVSRMRGARRHDIGAMLIDAFQPLNAA